MTLDRVLTCGLTVQTYHSTQQELIGELYAMDINT